jgi:hypothetical protein
MEHCGATSRVFGGRTCELEKDHDYGKERIQHRTGSVVWMDVSYEDGVIPDDESVDD